MVEGNLCMKVFVPAVVLFLSFLIPTDFLWAGMTSAEIRQELTPLQAFSLLKGHFEQIKTIKDLNVSIKTTGEYELSKDQSGQVMVRWKIQKPEPMNICIDVKQIVFDNLGLHKKTTLKLEEVSQQDSSGMTKLMSLIRLDPQEMNQNFNIDKKKSLLIVTPKELKANSFKKAEIELDHGKNLKSVNLVESNEDTLQIQFTKTKVDRAAAPMQKVNYCE